MDSSLPARRSPQDVGGRSERRCMFHSCDGEERIGERVIRRIGDPVNRRNGEWEKRRVREMENNQSANTIAHSPNRPLYKLYNLYQLYKLGTESVGLLRPDLLRLDEKYDEPKSRCFVSGIERDWTCKRSEVGSQRSEVRGRKSEVRSQKSVVGSQYSRRCTSACSVRNDRREPVLCRSATTPRSVGSRKDVGAMQSRTE